MTYILIGMREETQRQMNNGKMAEDTGTTAWEDRDRDWSGVPTSQEHQAQPVITESWETRREQILPQNIQKD